MISPHNLNKIINELCHLKGINIYVVLQLIDRFLKQHLAQSIQSNAIVFFCCHAHKHQHQLVTQSL